MSTNDPFGFIAAINWDVVDEHADEIAAIFEPDALDQQREDAATLRQEMAEAQAEDEQAHWEDDPEYRAIYCPPT